MVTNGTLLNENMIIGLERAGLKRIRLSIDEVGDKTEVRDWVKPNDIWEKALLIKKVSNIQVCIHTVCSPYNVKKLFEVYQKVLEVGAARWRVFDIGFQGGIISNKVAFSFNTYYNDLIDSTKKILDHYLSNNLTEALDIEINNVFKTSFLKLEDVSNKIDLLNEISKRQHLSPCNYIVNHQISIRSNGEATLCQYFHDPIFEYKKYNFDVEKAICNENCVQENELKVGDLEYCKDCRYIMLCGSGCRSRAKFLTNNIKDADPGACYLHPLVHNSIISMLPQNVQNTYSSYILPRGKKPKYNAKDLVELLRRKGYYEEKK